MKSVCSGAGSEREEAEISALKPSLDGASTVFGVTHF
jgi:hypothetical protein